MNTLPPETPPASPTELPVQAEAVLLTPPNPLPVEAVPQTAEDMSARLSGLRGLWTRTKEAITVTARGGEGGNAFNHELSVGQSIKARLLGRLTLARTRASMQGEEYDPAVHNRTVQNNLYRHVANDQRVENHLQTHDPRWDRYARGKVGRAEAVRAVPGNVMAAIIGSVALVGPLVIKAGATRAEVGSPLYQANEAQKELAGNVVSWLDKQQKRGIAKPRTSADRASAVYGLVGPRERRQRWDREEAARRADPRNAAHYARLEESLRQRAA